MEVFGDFGGEDGGRWEVVGVGEAVVAQPEDVEAYFVSGQQLVVGKAFEAAGLFAAVRFAGWIGESDSGLSMPCSSRFMVHNRAGRSAISQPVNLFMGGHAPTPPSIQRRTFPRFSTRDRTTALLVKSDALVIETTAYAGWAESFRPLVAEVVHAMERISQPNGVLRIGLRYIDEIRVPGIDSAPGDWRGYIDEHLLAAADPEFIPESLCPSEWLGRVQYQTAPDSMLTVRYGPQLGYPADPAGPTRRRDPHPPGLFFLLDADSYWHDEAEVPEFKAEWICKRCDLLHQPVSEFCRIVVTDKLRDEVFNKQEGDEQ